MKFLSPFILLFSLLTFTSCYRDTYSDESSTTVEGFVADSQGNRVKDAIVFVERLKEYSNTDEKGAYKFTHIPEGIVTFIASAPLYLPRIVSLEISPSRVQKGVNFVLTPEPGLISSVKSATPGSLRVIISWNTRFLGDSQVEFGINPSFGFMSERDLQPTLNHQVELKNLLPNQTYYYRVRSYDKRGYLFYLDGGTFTPLDFPEKAGPPEAPTDLKIKPGIRQGSVNLSWKRSAFSEDLIGYNIYGTNSRTGTFKKLNPSVVPADFDFFEDQALLPLQKYYYYVKGVDGEGFESDPTLIESLVVPGLLDRAIIWSQSEGPYVIRGDIEVAKTGVWRIEEGTVVLFQKDERNLFLEGDKIEVEISGEAHFLGTASNPVRLAGFFGGREDWGGLLFNNPSGGNLNFCQISGNSNPAFFFLDKGLPILGCRFEQSHKGIRLQGVEDFTLDSLFFSDVLQPLLIVNSSNIVIQNCVGAIGEIGIKSDNTASLALRFNDLRNYSLSALEINNPKGATVIHNNILAPIQGVGVDFVNASGSFQFNTLQSLSSGLRIQSGKLDIVNNILFSAPTLGAVGMENSLASLSVRFNSISNFILPLSGITALSPLNFGTPAFVGGNPFDYSILPGDPHLSSGEGGVQVGRFGP